MVLHYTLRCHSVSIPAERSIALNKGQGASTTDCAKVSVGGLSPWLEHHLLYSELLLDLQGSICKGPDVEEIREDEGRIRKKKQLGMSETKRTQHLYGWGEPIFDGKFYRRVGECICGAQAISSSKYERHGFNIYSWRRNSKETFKKMSNCVPVPSCTRKLPRRPDKNEGKGRTGGVPKSASKYVGHHIWGKGPWRNLGKYSQQEAICKFCSLKVIFRKRRGQYKLHKLLIDGRWVMGCHPSIMPILKEGYAYLPTCPGPSGRAVQA